jgi:hypothetical protein
LKIFKKKPKNKFSRKISRPIFLNVKKFSLFAQTYSKKIKTQKMRGGQIQKIFSKKISNLT